MAKKTAKKAAKKKASKASSSKKKAAAPPIESAEPQEKHPINLHNITNATVLWRISAKGQRVEGITPAMGQSRVRLDHAKSYRISFRKFDKSGKKGASCDCRVVPDGSAIFNGRKIHVTHPH